MGTLERAPAILFTFMETLQAFSYVALHQKKQET